MVTDPHIGDTLTGLMNWDDGITRPVTFSVDPLGDGKTYIGSTSHSYSNPGIYRVSLTVTDSYGNSATKESENYIATFDPDAGYVIGAGSIDSPAGAYKADSGTGKAYFGFVSKYIRGKSVPEGLTEFYYETPKMNFYSVRNEWLIVEGAQATYKGTGKISGKTGDYTFVVSSVDGALKTTDKFDRFRIKITDKTTGATVYDNNLNPADDAVPETKIRTGFIIIVKK
jgi:PKD repeat protein